MVGGLALVLGYEGSLQEAINEGSYQCWKLIKKPSPLGFWAAVLIWNTSGFFSGKMIYLWCCGPEAGRASYAPGGSSGPSQPP